MLSAAVFPGCGGLVEYGPREGTPSDAPASIEGTYWWSGAGVSYGEGALGPFTKNTGATTHAAEAQITRQGERYFLTIPDCQSGIPLTTVPASPRFFMARDVDCAIDDIGKALGLAQRSIQGLRINLERRAMAVRECLTYEDGTTTCGQSTSSFQPLGEGSAGRGAAIAGRGDPSRKVVNFSDSRFAWRFDKDNSVMWECAEVDRSKHECAAGAFRKQIEGISGALYRMNDGLFHIAGYDCRIAVPYSGDPYRCGDSYEGMADIGLPEAWIYYFNLQGSDLHFEIEMHGKDYKYYVIVKAPVVPM